MVSRRDFLKLSGLGAVTFGAGFGTGKIFGMKSSGYLRVQAYLPDETSVSELTKLISDKLNHSGAPVVRGGGKWKRIIEEAYASNSADGKAVFRVEDLYKPFLSDFLISDNSCMIYNPSVDFNYPLNSFRSSIIGRYSAYLFSMEFRNENILSLLLKGNERVAIIEKEDGIYDRISLKESFNRIDLKGPYGMTSIGISEGKINTISSCCKNGICRLSGNISHPGEIIACAPNKILIRIEKV